MLRRHTTASLAHRVSATTALAHPLPALAHRLAAPAPGPIVLFLLLAFALAASTPARADLLITVKGHADAVKLGNRTQEARDSNVKIWLTKDKMRRDEGPLSAIVRLDRSKLYLINRDDKTYSVVDLPVDWTKLVPKNDLANFQQFVAESQMKAAVTPTTQTRKIHDWNAHLVNVELSSAHGPRVSTQMWVTKDLALYGAYNQMSGALASLQVSAADWSRKIAQLDGFPIYQETTVSVGGASFKSREEVAAAETREVPDVTYDPPAGFNPTPYDPFRAPD